MATWKNFVFNFYALFALTLAIKRDILDHNDIAYSKQNMNSLNEEVVHRITKRSVTNRDCAHQNDTFYSKLDSLTQSNTFHVQSTLDGNKDGSLSLAVAHSNNLYIVAVTYDVDVLLRNTSLYLSADGGRHFNYVNDKIENNLVQPDNGLQKHPRDDKVFVITVDGGKSKLWISTNGGQTFSSHDMGFPMYGDFIYNPVNKDYMLALSRHDLWITKNGGKNWTKIKEDVQNVKWSPDADNTIYASVSVKKDKFGDFLAIFGLEKESFDNDFMVSTDCGKTWDILHKHIYNFGVQGKFMFVSVFLDKERLEKAKRTLEVSTNKGKSWDEVQLPSITEEQFYSILDMSEGMVFIHVDSPGDTGEGTLYISDATGIVYSESLTRHLYPNHEELTDFYKVESIRGVYITSQLEKDNSIHTMITYDRGGEWRPITRPDKVECVDEKKACYLQIHNLFSRSKGVFNKPPLSVANAPGIIMVHGQVAENSKTTIPNVYVSSDGGYTWILGLEGPHHYQIADQGALLIAVPYVEHPKTIKFSTDEGQCWHEYEFTKDDLALTGLLVDPQNSGHTVAIWGASADREWTIHTFDFTFLVDAQCEEKDYEKWSPHWDLNTHADSIDQEYRGCLLGKRETFYRLKKDSWCLIQNERRLADVDESHQCPCSKADYDCDYGYTRVGSSDLCVEDKMFKGPKLDICFRGHEREIITKGYRRVPGDVCDASNPHSFMRNLGRKTIDLHKVCEDGDRSLLEEQVHDEFLPDEGAIPDLRKQKVGQAMLICLFVVLILAGLFVTAFFMRKHLVNKRLGRYRYSMLRTQDYGTDLQSTVAPHMSLYDDSSDEESRRDPISTSSTALLHNGGVSHFPPIKPPEISSNQPPKPPASGTQPEKQSGGIPPQDKVKSYHDDSDVDLLE